MLLPLVLSICLGICKIEVLSSYTDASPVTLSENLIRIPSFATRLNPDHWAIEINGVLQELKPMQKYLYKEYLDFAKGSQSVSDEKAASFANLLKTHFPGSDFQQVHIGFQVGESEKIYSTTLATVEHGKFREGRILRVSPTVRAGHESINYYVHGVEPSSNIGGRILFVEPQGFSVISDIDDTVKITGTKHDRDHYEHRFQKAFTPTPGMTQYYKELAQGLTSESVGMNAPSFHYVSGSLVEFLPALQHFLEVKQGFPQGSYHLQHHSPSTFDHKIAQIGDIMERLPERKFVLIGDSTSRDAEVNLIKRVHNFKAYAHFYNQGSVACIFIRLVEGMDSLEEQTFLNSYERFVQIFSGIPQERWQLFHHPSELPTAQEIAAGKCRK